MRILRSLIFGVVMALLAGVLGVLVELALMLSKFATGIGPPNVTVSGSGGLGAVSITSFVEFYALFGFVAGFVWHFWRGKRRRVQPATSL